ncbi:superoxide dismutase family protein [Fictibacillus aquaticus]|uniref:superoxide dismutase family protein n=1 Tax=Fictibacillus aquaticus TaxID=2021314 RepID=UPI001F0B2177|nr:superoxide dismutase family protein [Fictibacillus aquaticus]
MKKSITVLLVLLLIVSAAGCGKKKEDHENHESKASASDIKRSSKEVVLMNAAGKKSGTVHLTQTAEGVEIHVKAEGLTSGEHGFHFHETAKCTAPDFESAGKHFNPGKRKHGFNNPEGFHAGDIPNLKTDKSGNAEVTFVSQNVTLNKGAANSLLRKGGTSIVVHEKADDYKTDPSGNSGGRILCGEIK